MKEMKICVVAYKFGLPEEIGEHLGIYRYFLKELETLTQKGVAVFVVAPWLSWTKKGTSQIGQIKIYRTWPKLISLWWFFPFNRFLRFLYIWQTQRKILWLTKKEKIDLIYIWQARETGYAVAKIKAQLNQPVAFRQITTWQWNFKRTTREYFSHHFLQKLMNLPVLGKFFEKILEFLREVPTHQKFAQTIYRHCDKILVLSEGLKEEVLANNVPPSKIEIVPLAVETDIFKPLAKFDPENKNIIYVGRLHLRKKGINDLLLAFQKVIKEIPKSKLYLVGGGTDSDIEEIKKSIQELNLEKEVILVGPVPNKELPRYYALTQVAVVPSVWLEAFGRVAIEGMACGKPLVSTRVGGLAEINLDGETGLIVEPKNPSQLAEAILKILKNPDLAKEMSQKARERVEKFYTYEAVAEKLISIFKKLIKEYQNFEFSVCYFGAYHPNYSRNLILMKGLRKNKIRVIECHSRKKTPFKYLDLIFQHRKIKNKYKVMIVGFPGHSIMPLAWLLARLNGKKIIFDVFISLYDSNVFDRQICSPKSLKAKYFYFWDWLSCRLADKLLLDTQAQIDYFVKSFKLPPDKFVRIFVGSDEEFFFPQKKEKENNTFLVHFHGHLIPLHGIEYILKAAKILEKENIEFRIIERGQLHQKAHSLAQEFDLKNIRFLKPVPYYCLKEYINQGDVGLGIFGLTPKANRVIPNKIFEILACGKPLITAETSAAKELLSDKINCLFCRAGDEKDLAQKILQLKNNHQLREKIAQNGYQLFLDKLTPEKLGQELKEVLTNFYQTIQ